MDKETVLNVEHLSVGFRSSRKEWTTVVRDVSFSMKRGSVLCIVGESGCGKSVTANSIMHLLPKNQGKILSGSIQMQDTDLTFLTDRQMQKIRGKEIAMIFQDPLSSLNPVQTVAAQMVEMLCAKGRMTRPEALDRALSMLKKVGISEPEQRMKEYPFQLSGGMIQRVMIAMALSVEPKILIADEPTTALDVTIQAQVLDLMRKLREDSSMSILLITHDMGVVAEMAEDVMVMYAGEVVEYGTVEQILESPRHPYTQGLLKSLPRLDVDVDMLYSIEGTVPPPVDLPGCRFADRCEHCTAQCRTIKPPVITFADGRQVRCHLAGEEGSIHA